MKKITIPLLLISTVLVVPASAQLEKGTFLANIEGTMSYMGGRNAPYRSVSYRISPQPMWLVRNNLALGMKIDYGYSSWRSNPNYSGTLTAEFSNSRYYSLETGPLVRKYFGSRAIKPYIQLGGGFAVQWQHNKALDVTTRNSSMYFEPRAGVSWWLNDKVSVDLSGGYRFSNSSRYNYSLARLGITIKLNKPGK